MGCQKQNLTLPFPTGKRKEQFIQNVTFGRRGEDDFKRKLGLMGFSFQKGIL
jgi:hypothetical protein